MKRWDLNCRRQGITQKKAREKYRLFTRKRKSTAKICNVSINIVALVTQKYCCSGEATILLLW
jgi:hypothetical protein